MFLNDNSNFRKDKNRCKKGVREIIIPNLQRKIGPTKDTIFEAAHVFRTFTRLKIFQLNNMHVKTHADA